MSRPEASAALCPAPDFYIAAMGRSGSTMLCNWLTHPPDRLVLIEPFLFTRRNPDMVRQQLANFGLPVATAEWEADDPDWQSRFARLFAPRLAGRRWALKEVLACEHARVLAEIGPPKVAITVRDIAAVAASFLEKHRLQGNEDQYDTAWVRAYCEREAQGLVALVDRLAAEGRPYRVVRYEDFVASPGERAAVSAFLGWPGGGRTDRHLADFNRAFEVERHGSGIGQRVRPPAAAAAPPANAPPSDATEAAAIAERCQPYQRRFGYA